MKKKLFLSALLVTGFLITSCSNTSTDNKTATEQSGETGLQPVTDSLKVDWTAYKTTDKVPVAGSFTKVTLSNISSGTTLESVLNNATFTIDANELVTGDTARDRKIVQFFFSKMASPGEITGQLHYEEGQWSVALTMNGVTVGSLPAEMSFGQGVAQLKTTIDLNDFKALTALKSLNDACHELHMGSDGISKTWEVVDVVATLPFRK